jgi:hypothetical protein
MMGRLRQVRGQAVGLRRDQELELPSVNHFKQASMTAGLQTQIESRGLNRVAGNIFICNSTNDFWNVKDGKVLRITTVEVDNGETIASPQGDPRDFLDDALTDLTF